VPFHPYCGGALHFMITIPKQDKTTISLNNDGLIAIVQEDDAGETHTVLVNPQMAEVLIKGIESAAEESKRWPIPTIQDKAEAVCNPLKSNKASAQK